MAANITEILLNALLSQQLRTACREKEYTQHQVDIDTQDHL